MKMADGVQTGAPSHLIPRLPVSQMTIEQCRVELLANGEGKLPRQGSKKSIWVEEVIRSRTRRGVLGGENI